MCEWTAQVPSTTCKSSSHSSEYSKTPAFTFERLRRREFRDIVMNVSRLAKRNKICPDGYHYAAQFLTVDYS